MITEKNFAHMDFSRFSNIKESLLLKLKLRRRVINEEMSFEELDNVAAARGYYANYKINKEDIIKL